MKRGGLLNSGRNGWIIFYGRDGPTSRPADGGEAAHRRRRGCAPAASRGRRQRMRKSYHEERVEEESGKGKSCLDGGRVKAATFHLLSKQYYNFTLIMSNSSSLGLFHATQFKQRVILRILRVCYADAETNSALLSVSRILFSECSRCRRWIST